MKAIILISLFLITSSVYARSNSCPEANLSDEQTAQINDLRQSFRSSLQGQELTKEQKQAV